MFCSKIPPVLSFGTCTDTGRISMLVTALADHLDVDVSDLPIAVTAPSGWNKKILMSICSGLWSHHLSPTPCNSALP